MESSWDARLLCATGLQLGSEPLEQLVCMAGLYSLPLSVSPDLTGWTVAGDSLPLPGRVPSDRWPTGRYQEIGCLRNRIRRCHWASVEPLGLSPSVMATEQWSLQALRRPTPHSLYPPPLPWLHHHAKYFCFWGSWWHLWLDLSLDWTYFSLRRWILLWEEGAGLKMLASQLFAPSVAGESRVCFCDPGNPCSFLAIRKAPSQPHSSCLSSDAHTGWVLSQLMDEVDSVWTSQFFYHSSDRHFGCMANDYYNILSAVIVSDPIFVAS